MSEFISTVTIPLKEYEKLTEFKKEVFSKAILIYNAYQNLYMIIAKDQVDDFIIDENKRLMNKINKLESELLDIKIIIR